MLSVLDGLVRELRATGVPVAMSEHLDAARALAATDLIDRAAVRAALRATLVKDHAHDATFDLVFDVYFAGRARPAAPDVGPGAEDTPEGPPGDSPVGSPGGSPGSASAAGAGGGGPGSTLDALDDGELRAVLASAVHRGDSTLTRLVVGRFVDRHAGFEPGRPVAGTLYRLRTMRAIGTDALAAALTAAAAPPDGPPGRRTDGPTDGPVDEPVDVPPDGPPGRPTDGPTDGPGAPPDRVTGALDRRLARERAERGLQRVEGEVESEIRRRLVADRGAEAVARTLREPLPEDVEFLQASQRDSAALRVVVQPLARKLAARLATKRRHRSRGVLDFRRTVRASMSTGTAGAEPVFRPRRPAKPQLVVLADISGSVAAFAAFTLQLAYALRTEFAAVRSFVFVDGVDEVTDVLAGASDILAATREINARADGVWLDGRSDYGHAFESFREQVAGQLSRRTTVLVLGDARTNYHEPRAEALAAVAAVAGHVYWLNPEPRASWDSGDSVIGRYAPWCDRVVECRSIRQLRGFVESLD